MTLAILACLLASQPVMEWMEGETIVFQAPPGKGVWYPRLLTLPGGRMLCSYDTNLEGPTAVHLSLSEDGGRTWRHLARVSDRPGACANGHLAIHRRELLCAYRTVTPVRKTIELAASADDGKTWEHRATVAASPAGVWEPFLQPNRDGSLDIYYASEDRPPQFIAARTSRDGGRTWSAERVIASHPASRDGMPGVAQRGAERLVVFEAQDGAPNPFHIRAVHLDTAPPDAHSRQQVYRPASPSKYAGAPYALFTRGVLLVSFQTDEDRPENGLSHCVVKVVWSADFGRTWSAPHTVFSAEGGTALWAGLGVDRQGHPLCVASVQKPREGAAIVLRRGRVR